MSHNYNGASLQGPSLSLLTQLDFYNAASPGSSSSSSTSSSPRPQTPSPSSQISEDQEILANYYALLACDDPTYEIPRTIHTSTLKRIHQLVYENQNDVFWCPSKFDPATSSGPPPGMSWEEWKAKQDILLSSYAWYEKQKKELGEVDAAL